MRFRYAVAVVASVLAMDAASANTAVRGVTDSEIVLGSYTDLSGPAAKPGLDSINGVQMRVDEINTAGGINGRKIRLVVEDTQYQVPRAVQAANKLINRDNVFAMILDLGTSMNNAIFPTQEKANVPNLFPNTQARSMWLPFNRLKFQFHSDNQEQIAAGVKWMIENKGKKRICVEYQDNDMGKDYLTGVSNLLKAKGMSLTAAQSHKPTDTDLGTQILTLRNANCDLVVLGTLIRDAIIAYTTARRSGWTDVDFLGSNSVYDPTVAAVPDGATEGIYSVTSVWIPPADKMPASAKAWRATYVSKYGRDPTAASMNGYVAMDLTGIAMQKAGKDLSVASFIAGMESIKDYKDVFGSPPQNYSADSHLGSSDTYLAQVHNGAFIFSAGPISSK